jgi:hypothetical protein
MVTLPAKGREMLTLPTEGCLFVAMGSGLAADPVLPPPGGRCFWPRSTFIDPGKCINPPAFSFPAALPGSTKHVDTYMLGFLFF